MRKWRVFLASPGDVARERELLAGVADEVNETHGSVLGYELELVRWQTHTVPDAGRPQQVITEQVGTYDIFVGVMWRRFGTPTGVADSGTEEEFRIAYQRWEQDPGRVSLMFYFCQKPFMPRSLDEVDQVRKVLQFRQGMEGKALVWDYEGAETFEGVVRKHLCLRLNKLMEREKARSGALEGERIRVAHFAARQAAPDEGTIRDLHDLWPRMSPELQRAFSIAYNENRLAGDAGIKTADLFSAVQRVGAQPVQEVFRALPDQALPGPTGGVVVEEPYILQERPWLSHCVSASIRRLSAALPPGRKLTSVDIFADIAKHGTGKSVRLLRQHQVQPEDIDRILRQKQIDVVGA